MQIILGGDWRNVTAFVLDFINTTQGNLTLTNQTVADLRDRVCDDNELLRYFNFANETQAKDLQAQLCNLTVEEGIELFNDFRSNFALNQTLQEVCVDEGVIGCVT